MDRVEGETTLDYQPTGLSATVHLYVHPSPSPPPGHSSSPHQDAPDNMEGTGDVGALFPCQAPGSIIRWTGPFFTLGIAFQIIHHRLDFIVKIFPLEESCRDYYDFSNLRKDHKLERRKSSWLLINMKDEGSKG